MKKNLVIVMDCHGMEIYKYLNRNIKFMEKFNCQYISLNEYVIDNSLYFNNKEYTQFHQKIIKKADVLILQVIEKDRGFLNNCETIKLTKENCKIIKIPHYRNSVYRYKTLEGFYNKNDLIKGWELPNKTTNLNNINETISIIKNEINIMNNYNYDKNKLKQSLNYKINEFKKIDDLSDIKMNDYFLKNFRSKLLFKSRSYPSSIFFYELTNRILNELNILYKNDFKDLYFAENTSEPIPDYWYKFCNFEFENKYYTYGHIEIKEYEWYYILLLTNNVNIFDKNKIQEIINKIRSKK